MTVTIRDLSGMAEFRQAEALQRAVWGADDKEDPADLMMVIQHEGGLCAGAFRGGQMLGYVFAFPTVTPGVQHSHRLAVLDAARGLGLGMRLKWYQRDWCLARDIHLVRWTFDPARLPNAALNVARLGAGIGTYFEDYYGEMAGINQGAPSDRVLADWDLTAPGVVARAAGGTPALPDALARIAILPDFGTLLDTDPKAALAERLRLRAALQAAFAQGLRVVGFDTGTGDYLLA
jgi:predicted GNAT superfamily acetyltransferase